MRTRCSNSIGALCLVTLMSFSAHAADTNWRVKVTVSASESIKDSVSSYLNRELRSLNDVEVVNDNPDWEISVVAMELKTVGGYKNGIALSTVIVTPFNNQSLSGFFQPKFKTTGLQMTSGLSWYPDQWLNVGSADDLQKQCKDIITNFDVTTLEESRKSLQKVKELLNKSK